MTVDGAVAPHVVIAVGDAALHGDRRRDGLCASAYGRTAPLGGLCARRTCSGGSSSSCPHRFAARQLAAYDDVPIVTAGGATLATADIGGRPTTRVFAPPLVVSPVAPGQGVVRWSADTGGTTATAVDVAVRTRDRRARVFVFEPRPSWAAGFARQSLESDPLFDVRAVARTSRGVITRTAGAPVALSSLDPDSADVVLVGGLDALSAQISTRSAASRTSGAARSCWRRTRAYPTRSAGPSTCHPRGDAARAADAPSVRGPSRTCLRGAARRHRAMRQTRRLLAAPLRRRTGPPLARPGRLALSRRCRHRFTDFWRAPAADAGSGRRSPVTVRLESLPSSRPLVRVTASCPIASGSPGRC